MRRRPPGSKGHIRGERTQHPGRIPGDAAVGKTTSPSVVVVERRGASRHHVGHAIEKFVEHSVDHRQEVPFLSRQTDPEKVFDLDSGGNRLKISEPSKTPLQDKITLENEIWY